MGIEDASMRNGWADSVVVRPRTTEQHITVNKRLVLGFAISILTLIIVTAIAIILSVSFERCAVESSGALAANGSSNSKWKQSRDANISHRDSEDGQQPWRHLRLPATLRPRHYDLRLSVSMENFTFSGEVHIEFECVQSTKLIVLHTDRLEVEKVLVVLGQQESGRHEDPAPLPLPAPASVCDRAAQRDEAPQNIQDQHHFPRTHRARAPGLLPQLLCAEWRKKVKALQCPSQTLSCVLIIFCCYFGNCWCCLTIICAIKHFFWLINCCHINLPW